MGKVVIIVYLFRQRDVESCNVVVNALICVVVIAVGLVMCVVERCKLFRLVRLG